MKRKIFDLEERLLHYSARVIQLVDTMPRTRTAIHVGGQLLRSGTSPLFNHGEAEAAESSDDFVHKMKVCLKELRETKRALRLIARVPLVEDQTLIRQLIQETDEFIRIFFTSIRTAKNNITTKNTPRK